MEKSLLYRIILVVTLAVIAVTSLVPTALYDQETNESSLPEWWKGKLFGKVLPQSNLSLGLDLKGGMDLVVSVNVEQAINKELTYNEGTLKDYFKRELFPDPHNGGGGSSS